VVPEVRTRKNEPVEVRFDHQYRDDLGAFEVVPRVDGVPLTELIERFETGGGMRPADDAYGGLIPRFYRFGPMAEHFRGRSAGSTRPKTPLLGCDCGEWGCWPLMARITVTTDLVTWDSFEQPFRPMRDYTEFGPFEFDREQYDAALGDLSRAIDSEDS
jgi:hypothetical protein